MSFISMFCVNEVCRRKFVCSTCWCQYDPIIGYRPVATLAVLLTSPDASMTFLRFMSSHYLLIPMEYTEDIKLYEVGGYYYWHYGLEISYCIFIWKLHLQKFAPLINHHTKWFYVISFLLSLKLQQIQNLVLMWSNNFWAIIATLPNFCTWLISLL